MARRVTKCVVLHLSSRAYQRHLYPEFLSQMVCLMGPMSGEPPGIELGCL